ncbi:MAG: patatin-like phospholipase family protein [Bacilli bacterium]
MDIHDKDINQVSDGFIPFDTIALSLSGGGYRATGFHLGTITYLNNVKIYDNVLLERVKILSTVSGGTFTGVIYAESVSSGLGVLDCFDKLYKFMTEIDVIKEALVEMSSPSWNEHKNRNLINAFSQVYFEHLTKQKFEEMWKRPDSHLSEICFNATDFSSGINFRFQRTKDDQGYFGNYYQREDIAALKSIRLSDIIATSSCFPGGFEPMIFPNDFVNDSVADFTRYSNKSEQQDLLVTPILLMDGGIYDNQGIDAIILANERLKKFYPEYSGKTTPIDLLILSDVADWRMTPLRFSEKKHSSNILQNITLKDFFIGRHLFAILSFTMLLLMVQAQSKLLLLIEAIVFGISVVLYCLITWVHFLLKGSILSKFSIPKSIIKHREYLLKIRISTLMNLLQQRYKSVFHMVYNVFTNQIRRLSIKQIYENESWQNRRVLNAIWDLSSKNVERRKNRKLNILSKKLLCPSESIIINTKEAENMGTTLWFEDQQLIGNINMLDRIIACGQYTTCFNLLEYIETLRQTDLYKMHCKNHNDGLNELYTSLMLDWDRFNQDPYWLVKLLKNEVGERNGVNNKAHKI